MTIAYPKHDFLTILFLTLLCLVPNTKYNATEYNGSFYSILVLWNKAENNSFRQIVSDLIGYILNIVKDPNSLLIIT